MFAVIFAVEPKPERWDDYLALAAALRPELERIDGFIENERFRSCERAGRVLSLSIWRDEKAVIRWRALARHHYAQARGRAEIFADYHLRVGEITADNRLPGGQSLLQQRFDETEIGIAKCVTLSALRGTSSGARDLGKDLDLPHAAGAGIVDHESFTGINDPEQQLLLVSWHNTAAAAAWQPDRRHAGVHHRAVRIIRDYGMHDRREAPQYYPDAPTRS